MSLKVEPFVFNKFETLHQIPSKKIFLSSLIVWINSVPIINKMTKGTGLKFSTKPSGLVKKKCRNNGKTVHKEKREKTLFQSIFWPWCSHGTHRLIVQVTHHEVIPPMVKNKRNEKKQSHLIKMHHSISARRIGYLYICYIDDS
jgi:hypothetical protein